jgi:phosphoglycerate dehydrogenase-like enzyme
VSFKIALLPPKLQSHWPEEIRRVAAGAEVAIFDGPDAAVDFIVDADAAYGTVPADLLAQAKKLRWIAAPGAGLGESWFYPELIASDVIVTNQRGIYNELLSCHAMALLLALARKLDGYMGLKQKKIWSPLGDGPYLPESTVLIVGVGGIGTEIAKLSSAFGITVIGVDPRVDSPPEFVSELHEPDALDRLLSRADFVVLTVPETPETRRMMSLDRFRRMKSTAYFINVGRGACVVLDDLVAALDEKAIAGAGLDVYELEPLPEDHPLWTADNVIMTPHVGANDESPHIERRRTDLLIENCRRFASGEPLLNVVEKAKWF